MFDEVQNQLAGEAAARQAEADRQAKARAEALPSESLKAAEQQKLYAEFAATLKRLGVRPERLEVRKWHGGGIGGKSTRSDGARPAAGSTLTAN
jgi:hypothetical protein